MSFIRFENVKFTYPLIEGDIDENGNQIIPQPIFSHFTAELPKGFVCLVGPNASGKSTFMLLASGRLTPQEGKVYLFNQEMTTCSEEEREKLASFIYQNMEFETDDKVSDLLKFVFTNGFFKGNANKLCADLKFENKQSEISYKNSKSFLEQTIAALELENILQNKLNTLSKGEMQRVILAFSMLYGSKSIFMDEPLFALETPQKHRALTFIKE